MARDKDDDLLQTMVFAKDNVAVKLWIYGLTFYCSRRLT